MAWEQDVTGFDPHWTSGLQVTYIAGNLFNNLVTIDQDLNYIPELAESWEHRTTEGLRVQAAEGREIP